MKILFSLISVCFFIACNYKSKVVTKYTTTENSKIVEIKLADSLGTVNISLPIRYDTFFSWTHYSDCGKPCDRIKYRFQPISLPITKESGWIWLGEPKDSIERFTIIHSGYFPFHKISDSNFMRGYHEHQKVGLIYDSTSYKINSDTLEKIGNRYFSLITIDLYDTSQARYSKKLLAATTIKSNIIEFNFELLTKLKDSAKNTFLENSKNYLHSIHISNGK
jgi:hypothetical protein